MSGTLDLAPSPDGARGIVWREWGGDAFAEAVQLDRPVFLHLAAPWCAWCRLMDQTTLADAGVISRLNEHVLPVRVDSDRYPHVFERYAAGGWPSNAFLTPSGEVLWAATFVEASDLQRICDGVVRAWTERREEFREEVARRHRVAVATVGRHAVLGLVRREAADDVESALRDAFDARNGGFGDAPKFPNPRAVELALVLGERADPDWFEIADRTLDGMLAGELIDRAEGGFFRYALAPDWTDPSREKLLEVNAAMLRAYAMGAAARGRADWRTVVEDAVAWVDRALALPDGLWAASQAATPGSSDVADDARAGAPRPALDRTLLTDANAQWIGALADAGGRLGRYDWVARAETALWRLVKAMRSSSGRFFHFRPEGGAATVDHLLLDLLAIGRACLDVAQATGSTDAVVEAVRIRNVIEESFWADDGGFHDRVRGVDEHGVLRYHDRPFEVNAETARFLLDLVSLTGEASARACAERTLARLGPTAGRQGVVGAEFALGVYEFFDAPMRIFLIGDPAATARLRQEALAAPIADRRVWTLPKGGRVGTLSLAAPLPAAIICRSGDCSAPIADADRLQAALRSGASC
jgi:uncharacterized protein